MVQAFIPIGSFNINYYLLSVYLDYQVTLFAFAATMIMVNKDYQSSRNDNFLITFKQFGQK